MRRRNFISIVGGLVLGCPLVVRAEQPLKRVIGYINSRSRSESADIVTAFLQGLKEAGFVDGENVRVIYQFAAGQFDQLPDLASDMLRERVDVIVATGGTVSAVKVKPVVPRSIPIVFAMGGDPVKLGVVASLNRPDENITGVAFLVNGLASKQIELLHELVPKSHIIGFLVNPKDPNAHSDVADAKAAAKSFGQNVVVAEVSTDGDLEQAFSSFSQQQVEAVFVDAEPFLLDQHKKIIALASQRSMPLVSQFRSFAADGALASYGTSLTEANRQLGLYTGRVLKGARPSDLPVVQSTKFDLVINLKTAKALGITISPTLLARADDVIE